MFKSELAVTGILVATLAALLTWGCASLFSGTPTTQQVLAKIVIQQATLRAIQAGGDPGQRATAVVSIVDEALEVVRSGEDAVITAAELQAALDLVLPQDLSPADQLLAADLVTLLVAEVNRRLPEEQLGLPLAEVSAVLSWVREAALLLVPEAPAPVEPPVTVPDPGEPTEPPVVRPPPTDEPAPLPGTPPITPPVTVPQ